MIYFPPGMLAGLLMARDMPIIITDGEFKTLALWRLAHHNVEGDQGEAEVPHACRVRA